MYKLIYIYPPTMPICAKFTVGGVEFDIIVTELQVSARASKHNLYFLAILETNALISKVKHAIINKSSHLAINEATYRSLRLAITIKDHGSFESYQIDLQPVDPLYTPLDLLLPLFETTEDFVYFTKIQTYYSQIKKELGQLAEYRENWQTKYEQQKSINVEKSFELERVYNQLESLEKELAEQKAEMLNKEIEMLNKEASIVEHQNIITAKDVEISSIRKERRELIVENTKLQKHRNQLRRHNKKLIQSADIH
jgi:hypothetical protein